MRIALAGFANLTAAAILAAGTLACSSSATEDRTPQAAKGSTLAIVRDRGYVICGAGQSTVGFSTPDRDGYWRGLDVDTCRAIAAAVLGDREKARFVPLTGQQRITALQTGQIDVLPRTTTWTLLRDANGINFTYPNYYDFTGFMVHSRHGVKDVRGLKGASVCIQTGSMPEVTFTDVSRKYALELRPVVYESVQATRQAFFAGRCDALITDASALASVRATRSDDPKSYVIFPANDDVTPLTPAVRHGDDQWLDVVTYAIQAMLVAEHLGITQENVDEMLESEDPIIQRFLGVERGNGGALGLSEDWAYNVVKQVGNYAEVYERNVGAESPLKIERGLNRLVRDGGLMLPIGFF